MNMGGKKLLENGRFGRRAHSGGGKKQKGLIRIYREKSDDCPTSLPYSMLAKTNRNRASKGFNKKRRAYKTFKCQSKLCLKNHIASSKDTRKQFEAPPFSYNFIYKTIKKLFQRAPNPPSSIFRSVSYLPVRTRVFFLEHGFSC